MAWLSELGDPFAASALDRDGRAAIDRGVYGVPETFVIDTRRAHRLPVTSARCSRRTSSGRSCRCWRS